jgi:hypothetical protein
MELKKILISNPKKSLFSLFASHILTSSQNIPGFPIFRQPLEALRSFSRPLRSVLFF